MQRRYLSVLFAALMIIGLLMMSHYRPAHAAVGLEFFEATWTEAGVELVWETATEDGTALYALKRATSETDFIPVSDDDWQDDVISVMQDGTEVTFILARGGFSPTLYETLDDDALTDGETYYYMLVEITEDQSRDALEVVSVTIGDDDSGGGGDDPGNGGGFTFPPTETPQPTATNTPEPTATSRATSTPRPTSTPTEEVEPTATDEPDATSTPTATPADEEEDATPEPTDEAEPTEEARPTSVPTSTSVPTATDEPEAEPTVGLILPGEEEEEAGEEEEETQPIEFPTAQPPLREEDSAENDTGYPIVIAPAPANDVSIGESSDVQDPDVQAPDEADTAQPFSAFDDAADNDNAGEAGSAQEATTVQQPSVSTSAADAYPVEESTQITIQEVTTNSAESSGQTTQPDADVADNATVSEADSPPQPVVVAEVPSTEQQAAAGSSTAADSAGLSTASNRFDADDDTLPEPMSVTNSNLSVNQQQNSANSRVVMWGGFIAGLLIFLAGVIGLNSLFNRR